MVGHLSVQNITNPNPKEASIMSFIVANDIKKIYNEKSENPVQALRGIKMTINKNDFVAIEGTSGSGKSTLMHIMAGLDNATSGSLKVDNTEVTLLKSKELATYRNTKIGIVLQDFFLIEYRTVIDNVAVPLLFGKTKISNLNAPIENVLKQLNIDHLMHRKVNQLSGGQKQRVAIARAMVNNPDILLADEPTGALDSKTTMDIIELFGNLNSLGKTVIIITHDPLVSKHAKNVIRIEDGLVK
jgi:putative ABC transport system ATP-binding protein